MKTLKLLPLCLIVTNLLAAPMDADAPSAAHVQAIYAHLIEQHWVPQTGLFISYLNNDDVRISQQASTYDQAVVGLLALEMGDAPRAEGIFNFLKNVWYEAPRHIGARENVYGLANFYNAEFGGEGVESTMNLGPNAWAALFAARLAEKTQNRKAFQWALEVATWIARNIPHQNGGVAMGPVYGVDGNFWSHVYSTENNISYHALLSELLRSSRLSPKDKVWIQQEKDNIEHWLVQTSFDPKTYVMNRGLNGEGVDTIRALDTFTWLIAELGPEHVAALGIDPDRLMQKTKELFEVTVAGRNGVDPTDQQEADYMFSHNSESSRDFPDRSALDHHRMIWYEGLGQYVVATEMMASYAQTKGLTQKAADYSAQAQRLISDFDLAALKNVPDKAAYPYATQGRSARNGWVSTSNQASSVVAACYRCFVELGIDPLSGRSIRNGSPMHASLPVLNKSPHTTPELLYGSSQSMITKAWDDMNHGHADVALRQAQATIDQWATAAQDLERRKAHDVGHLIVDTHKPDIRNQIFSYGILNDVGAAYFLMGKIQDERGDYEAANGAFRQIVQHYALAQVWDHSQWLFWAPIDSIKNEYVHQHPDQYSSLLPTTPTP